jgi:LPXTG-motif cell wall-anchored protein
VKAATTGKEKAAEEKTSTGSLPATGSELPLLGLLGLVSLAAGLYIRK